MRTRALAEALSAWLNRCGISAIRNLNARSFTGSNVSEDKGGKLLSYFCCFSDILYIF